MKVLATSHGIASQEGQPSSDCFAARSWDQTVIAVLSDGAGDGEPAREAAQRAVKSLIDNYQARPRSWAPERALAEFARSLSRSLYQESQERFGRTEMVATLAAVVIEGGRLHGLNLGDSRVFLRQGGGMRALSTDHVDAERPHILTRALGLAPEAEPAFFSADLHDGDSVLLCSDGVWGSLPAESLASEMQKHSPARSIVLAARERATEESLDDMSAIAIEVRRAGMLRPVSERALSIPDRLGKGDVVDGFELLRHFHGADRVWLAEKGGMRVVLKFAPREAADSPAHLDAFTREAWNAARIQSPRFVRAHEPAGQTARYYVMEFVDAPSLATVLQERLLSVDSAVAMGKFIAAAGQELLRLDLAHGDIKPENILCIGDYSRLDFKLVDLGSAAPLFSVTSRAGTASYLAPERFQGAAISERTEIFSIGVSLYQALTGRLPYGEIERFQMPAFNAPRRPSKLNPNIPPWLDAVILRCIARNPAKRHQHFSELMHDLEHPGQAQPYFEDDTPLIERNPLAFYKAGFFIFLLTSLWLALKLLGRA